MMQQLYDVSFQKDDLSLNNTIIPTEQRRERLGVNLNYRPVTASEAQSHAWGCCFER